MSTRPSSRTVPVPLVARRWWTPRPSVLSACWLGPSSVGCPSTSTRAGTSKPFTRKTVCVAAFDQAQASPAAASASVAARTSASFVLIVRPAPVPNSPPPSVRLFARRPRVRLRRVQRARRLERRAEPQRGEDAVAELVVRAARHRLVEPLGPGLLLSRDRGGADDLGGTFRGAGPGEARLGFAAYAQAYVPLRPQAGQPRASPVQPRTARLGLRADACG